MNKCLSPSQPLAVLHYGLSLAAFWSTSTRREAQGKAEERENVAATLKGFPEQWERSWGWRSPRDTEDGVPSWLWEFRERLSQKTVVELRLDG